TPDVGHFGVFSDQAREALDRRLGLPGLDVGEALLDPGESPLLPLGIREGAAGERRAAQVAERGELRRRLRVDGVRGSEVAVVGFQVGAESGALPALLFAQVGGLRRVLLEIVELRIGTLDVVVAAPIPADQRGEIAPAEVEARVEGLGVDLPPGGTIAQ